jgi:hypothetical protein
MILYLIEIMRAIISNRNKLLIYVLGLDIPKHGETAYPAEAYGHGWGEKGDTLAGLAKTAIASSTVTAINEG